SGEPEQTQDCPAAVDALHHEIVRLRQADLVGKRREMRAGRNECQSGNKDCEELNEPHGHAEPLSEANKRRSETFHTPNGRHAACSPDHWLTSKEAPED